MKRFDVLVAYDVDTTTQSGERRLRKTCRICKDFGQRVQYTLYAVTVTQVEFETLKARLLDLLDPGADSLHFYRLPGGRKACLEAHGRDRYTNFDDPLIL